MGALAYETSSKLFFFHQHDMNTTRTDKAGSNRPRLQPRSISFSRVGISQSTFSGINSLCCIVCYEAAMVTIKDGLLEIEGGEGGKFSSPH